MASRAATRIISTKPEERGVRGYLVFPVDDALGSSSGARLALKAGSNTVGRESECDINIPRSTVSKRHAVIYVEKKLVFIEDTRSANHTYIVDEEEDEQVELKPLTRYQILDGNLVRLGQFEMRVQLPKAWPVEPSLLAIEERKASQASTAVSETGAIAAPAEEEDPEDLEPPPPQRMSAGPTHVTHVTLDNDDDLEPPDPREADGDRIPSFPSAAGSTRGPPAVPAASVLTPSPSDPASVAPAHSAPPVPSVSSPPVPSVPSAPPVPAPVVEAAAPAPPPEGESGSDGDISPPDVLNPGSVPPPPAVALGLAAAPSVVSVIADADDDETDDGAGDDGAGAEGTGMGTLALSSVVAPGMDIDGDKATISMASRIKTGGTETQPAEGGVAEEAEEEAASGATKRKRTAPDAVEEEKPKESEKEVGVEDKAEEEGTAPPQPKRRRGRVAAEKKIADMDSDDDTDMLPSPPKPSRTAASGPSPRKKRAPLKADSTASVLEPAAETTSTPTPKGRKRAPVKADSTVSVPEPEAETTPTPATPPKRGKRAATTPGKEAKESEKEHVADTPSPGARKRANVLRKNPVWQYKGDLRFGEDASAADEDKKIWRAYGEEQQKQLETAFSRKQKQCTLTVSSTKYLVKFPDMVQCRKDDQYKQRPIRRILE